MGRSKHGSSSGLHHDYHDNVYILVHGRKQFRVYSPDQAEYLATYGTIDRVYFNGRISYVGDTDIHADGHPMIDGDENEENTDDAGVVIGKGFDYISSDDDDSGELDKFPDDFDEVIDQDDIETENDDSSSNNEGITSKYKDSSKSIPSFSCIDLTLPESTLKSKYPQLNSTIQQTIEVRGGQMLYLPAGWFHEVTSFSSNNSSLPQNPDNRLEDCHCALNYWFHPPDALESFHNPYISDFWRKELEKALKSHPS